ncbi:MAG TPA: sigma-70 family RNA polymerase sigma factor [Bacteroidota bacterium]|nr:sigma-70 family RNA polymerase sigma factor [Bacteroidota bacterium]
MELFFDRLVNEALNVFHIQVEEAEELASDVLLTVVQKIDRFQFKRSDKDFHVWVITIFRNRVRDYLRQKALTTGLVESYQESALEEEGAYGRTEREVVLAILRRHEESLRAEEPDDPPPTNQNERRLQDIVDVLDQLEAWERVLLRCRALDIPYEEISHYTGKSVKQLKVYHARVKKKFMNLLALRYPELNHEERSR